MTTGASSPKHPYFWRYCINFKLFTTIVSPHKPRPLRGRGFGAESDCHFTTGTPSFGGERHRLAAPKDNNCSTSADLFDSAALLFSDRRAETSRGWRRDRLSRRQVAGSRDAAPCRLCCDITGICLPSVSRGSGDGYSAAVPVGLTSS